MINLTTLSDSFPVSVDETEYSQYIQKKERGWSNCEDTLEWLSKLHYLRKGFKEGRIKKEEVAKKEAELVLNWWKRWC